MQSFRQITVVPPNSRLIGSKKNRELGDLITVVNRSSQKLLLSKIKDIWIFPPFTQLNQLIKKKPVNKKSKIDTFFKNV